jgi:hypothetical protein
MPQSACISPQADGGIRTHDPRFTRVSRTGKRRGFEGVRGQEVPAIRQVQVREDETRTPGDFRADVRVLYARLPHLKPA